MNDRAVAAVAVLKRRVEVGHPLCGVEGNLVGLCSGGAPPGDVQLLVEGVAPQELLHDEERGLRGKAKQADEMRMAHCPSTPATSKQT